jgi:hypothetical protein
MEPWRLPRGTQVTSTIAGGMGNSSNAALLQATVAKEILASLASQASKTTNLPLSSPPPPAPSSSSNRLLSCEQIRAPAFCRFQRGRRPRGPVLRPLGQVEGGALLPRQRLDARGAVLPAQPRRGLPVRTVPVLLSGDERRARPTAASMAFVTSGWRVWAWKKSRTVAVSVAVKKRAGEWPWKERIVAQR